MSDLRDALAEWVSFDGTPDAPCYLCDGAPHTDDCRVMRDRRLLAAPQPEPSAGLRAALSWRTWTPPSGEGPIAKLIRMFARNEGDEALLLELVDAIRDYDRDAGEDFAARSEPP